ncbi:Hypothetical predicted protein [Mytilus galloprovincialis]|uniref:Uncharacterized protein n=1 Tax=Mytilus galloprovincialis TaxID=29158 RepID=A0A8B6EED9_MYTGA|nr:Hypothetical predicted protein [Mytilus galloprovincialis]
MDLAVCLFILNVFIERCLGAFNGEATLMDHILSGYNPAARPRINATESVMVDVGFYLTRLDHTDLRNNKMITTGWMVVRWHDDFLRWNATDFNNISKIIVPTAKVWKPDLALDNSADDLYTSIYNSAFQVVIYSNGSMMWEPGGSFSTVCYFDIRSYPFDHQTCEIIFTSWHYTLDMLNLSCSGNVNKDTFWRNGEWEIEHTKLIRREWSSGGNTLEDIYPEIVIQIHMRRKILYYIINIVLPCFFMSLLVLMVFHLPPDAGEKVSLGVTVLLAFSVFQLMIAESVPSTSDATPMLEIYLLFFMAESTFSVAVSVIVLNLHLRTEYKPPPNWLRKLVLHWMAKMLFMNVSEANKVVPENKDSAHSKDFASSSMPEVHVDRKESKIISNFHTCHTHEPHPHELHTHEPHPHELHTHDQHIHEAHSNELHIHEPHQHEQHLHEPHHHEQHLHELHTHELHPPTINIGESHSADSGMKDHSSSHFHTVHSPVSTKVHFDDHSNMSPQLEKSALRVMKSLANLDHVPKNQSRIEFMKLIKDTYRDLCQQRADDELDQLFENEWKRIARVVDRFFFLITSMFIVISSIAIFAVIPYGHSD